MCETKHYTHNIDTESGSLDHNLYYWDGSDCVILYAGPLLPWRRKRSSRRVVRCHHQSVEEEEEEELRVASTSS